MSKIYGILFLISCSDPAARQTLRTGSGGKKSALPAAPAQGSGSSQAGTVLPTPSPSPSPSPIPSPNPKPADPVVAVPSDPVAGLPCTQSAMIAKTKKICETTVQGIKVKF